jgi:hypothetical protein
MQAVAGFCLLLFVAVSTLVGVRVLMLAHRTKARPELLMGTGMVLIAGVGYPSTILAGFGGAVGEMSVPIYAAGCFLTQVGITLIFAFTQQVFRPHDGWARALVAAGAAIMLVSLVGATRALATADALATSFLVARSWLAVAMVGYTACFLWTAIEGIVHHGKAVKRMALGLADPVISNRFLLWGVFGLMATGINFASVTGNVLGVDPTRAPLVLVPMGVLGGGASVAMYLAFFPPSWYIAWVRQPARA